jgi:TetR/AcrR family transcriptional regulator, repressor for neighboring sulfatase
VGKYACDDAFGTNIGYTNECPHRSNYKGAHMSGTQEGAQAADLDPRPAGRDEVVDATVRAAAILFAEHNPNQVSVREIAAKAGVSHALVHRYLGSKHDIFRAVLERDRDEAAEYWMTDHGLNRTASTFKADLPPGRYLRTVMRAALEGVPLTPEDMRFPHAERMLSALQAGDIPHAQDERGFDMRLLFAAATAMAAGMAIAEDFFLVQAGIEDADRSEIDSEIDRLIMRLMTLVDTQPDATQ